MAAGDDITIRVLVRDASSGPLRDIRQGIQRVGSAARDTGDQSTRAFRRVNDALGGTGSRIDSLLEKAKGMAVGFAAAIVGGSLIQYGKDAVMMASDIEESVNKIKTIFGTASDQVNEFAEQGPRVLGQTSLAVKNAAGQFGAYGKSAGLAAEANAKFSTDLVSLSTDLASFYNTSPADAVTALGAAFRGEYEPIRAYNVMLDDATMRQKALELGLISTTKQGLTPQNKILAANALIFEQTKDAQGDFARTSDGLANQLRILNAQWEEGKGKIGELFLPAVNAVVSLLNDGLGPAIDFVVGMLRGFGDIWNNIPAPIRNAAGALALIVALRGPLSSLFSLILTRAGAAFAAFATALAASTGVMGLAAGAAKALWAALGGWVGVGITALVGILTWLIGREDEVTGSTVDFTSAIDANTGALQDNAAEVIAQQLSQNGVLDRYTALGGSVSDYTAAIMGNIDAQDEVHTLLLDQAQAAVESSQGWKAMTDAQKTAEGGSRAVASGILAAGEAGYYASDAMTAVLTSSADFALASDDLATKQGNAKTAIEAAKGAMKDEKAAAEDIIDPLKLMTEATDEMKKATEGADTATQFLQMSLDKMRGGAISAEQANRANDAAMRDVQSSALDLTEAQTKLTEVQNDGEATSMDLQRAELAVSRAEDGLFNSQVKAAASAVEMAGAAYDAALKNGTLEDAVKASNDVMVVQREKFLKAAAAAGIEKDDAKELADQLGLVPKDVTTAFNEKGLGGVQAQVDTLNDSLSALDKKRVKYWVIGGSAVQLSADNGTNAMSTTSYLMDQLYGNKAAGGLLRGPGTGTSDSLLIRASTGEYVVNARQTARNLSLLENLNAGKYAGGGLVTGNFSQAALPSGPDLASKTMGTLTSSIEAFFDQYMAAFSFSSNGDWGPGSSTGFAANTQAAKEFIERMFGGVSSIGGLYGGSVPGSDHPSGKALDVMLADYASQAGIDAGWRIANWFVAHPNSFGTKYVIFRNKFNDGGGWEPYTHPSGDNDTLAHRDHVHISFLTSAGRFAGQATDIGSMPTGGSGVERWRARVQQALNLVGQPLSYTDRTLMQLASESSGDPFAVNLGDDNAAAGNASRGLMQVTPSTFAMMASRSPIPLTNIWDPLQNIVAGMLWMLYSQGSLAGWSGTPYDKGGVFGDGAHAVNRSGRDEYILDPDETAAMKKGNRGRTVTIEAGAVQITVGSASPADRAALRAELERTLRSILSEDQERRL